MARKKKTKKILPKYEVKNGTAVISDQNIDHAKRYVSSSEGAKKAKNQGFSPISKGSEQRVSSAVESAVRKSNKREYTEREPYIFNELSESRGCIDNVCDGSFGSIQLKVKKGKFVGEAHYCADCMSLVSPIWRYQDSNYGVIHLCNLCKIAAFERSFGYADAMPLKVDHASLHKGEW